jgi:hypothetical protein
MKLVHWALLGLIAACSSLYAQGPRARDACAAIGPYYWEVGDARGPLASGSVNSTATEHYDANTPMTIDSASKWLYAAYVVQTRAIDAADRKYLQLRGGYISFAFCTARQTVLSCANAGNNDLYTPSADGSFYYDGGDMQHHGALGPMAPYNAGAVGAAVASALGIEVAYRSPHLAAGAVMTPAAYAGFLRKLMLDQLALGPMLGTSPICTNPKTCPSALSAPIPSSESWHYSIGHWIEDDPVQGDGSFSSPGATGFYPWVSADRRLYGIVAQDNHAAGWSSVQCGRQIRRAWSAQGAQPR